MKTNPVFIAGKYLILFFIIAAVLIPLIWVISLGFRTRGEIYEILPTTLTLRNFPEAFRQIREWGKISFVRMYINSILVTSASILGIITISSLGAFGFSHYDFRGKELIFIAFLLGIVIPIQVMLIPLFVLMKQLKLLKLYFVLILPYIAFGFPVAVLILRGFFEKIPIEIKEAAHIDGASAKTIFWRIVLPISKPALATCIVFAFLSFWNEFLFALVFVRKDSMQTIPVVLSRLLGSPFVTQYEIYAATVTLTIVPVLILYIFFQRWFIAGLSSGAVKG